jgi:peptide/nickel transport system permease protein
MNDMTDTAQTDANVDQKLKEAYFTASQNQLIWQRFKKNKSALIGAWVLIFLILSGIFAPFLTPYEPTIAGRDKDYLNGAPQIPQFCDDNGCSLRPFIYSYERTRSMKTNFRWVTEVKTDLESRRYLQYFTKGAQYTYLAFDINLPGRALDFRIPGFTFETRLFGVDSGMIHIFGTDSTGKDIYSRTLTAINTSLAVGTIGVFIAFVMALAIGGVAGYYGGWVDSALQMVTDTVRTIPSIPLFMALAAFIPDVWSAEARFFFISMVLGLIGWPTLARRIRTHLLTERNQEYVLAAQLCGASPGHVIRRHLLPSFTSYIIVDLVISFPYMVLSETALSFIGLGLKDPVNSLGVMLQNVTSVDVLLNYQWYFIPVIFFITLVLAFVFVGDGLRDAADPYSDAKK